MLTHSQNDGNMKRIKKECANKRMEPRVLNEECKICRTQLAEVWK